MDTHPLKNDLTTLFADQLFWYGCSSLFPALLHHNNDREKAVKQAYITDLVFRARVDVLTTRILTILDRHDVFNYIELLDSYQAVQEDLVIAQHRIKALEKQLEEIN